MCAKRAKRHGRNVLVAQSGDTTWTLVLFPCPCQFWQRTKSRVVSGRGDALVFLVLRTLPGC